MVDKDVLKECREYVEANEASAKEYLSRYFVITEYSLLQLETAVLFEFLYMLVEDIERTPGISYNKTTWLSPAISTQSPEAIVRMKWLKIPEHLSGLKCYRLTPRMFVTTPPDKPLRALSENLKTEEYTMSVLPVFHLSSFLALLHRRFPLTENCIKEYERDKSLRELQQLATVNNKAAARVSAQ